MGFVSDLERERAATALRRQYLSGRLSVEQLSERMELALVARERRDLRRAFRGLPPTWRDVDELVRVGRAAKRTAVLAALAAVWTAASLVLLVAFALTALIHGVTPGATAAFALIWLLASLVVWRARRRA